MLALAILPARPAAPRRRPGLLVFAAASVGCALADSLWLLLRLPRAAGGRRRRGAADRVRGAGRGRVARRAAGCGSAAALVGTAAGPAIGGVLTEVFDWRAIFAVQAPLALAAALA